MSEIACGTIGSYIAWIVGALLVGFGFGMLTGNQIQ